MKTFFDTIKKFLSGEQLHSDATKKKISASVTGKKNPRYKDGRRMYDKTVGGPKRCTACGTTKNLRVHHKDGSRKNHGRANLRWLCESCHSKRHKRGSNFHK